jgi:hypothetical protein
MSERSLDRVRTESLESPEHTHARKSGIGLSIRPPSSMLHLQQNAGNLAVQQLLRGGRAQPKLAISQPADPEEEEADQVADRVMRMHAGFPLSSACTCSEGDEHCELCGETASTVQRRVDGKEERNDVLDADTTQLPLLLRNQDGQALDAGTRGFFELRFGRDFHQVRVHTGNAATESARNINADAYTVGNDVFFASGKYSPQTNDGRLLLAHELTHTIQQGKAAVSSRKAQVNRLSSGELTRIQRQRGGSHVAAATPTLGGCRPVQDDLKPTAPWADLQKGYSSRCGSAVSDVAGQAEHTLSDLFHGRLPSSPHLPDARSSVDCVCATLSPKNAAISAMTVVLAAGPLAARLFWHFLGASGSPMTIDVAGMIASSAGVRAKIRQSIARGGNAGTTRLEQSDYGDRELQFAYGAIDCVQWQVVGAGRSWRSDPTTQIRVSMLDYYEFHPGRLGVSQCAHAACVECVARGDAKNFWTNGADVVSWHNLQHP